MDALCQDVSAVSLAARLRLALPARTEDCLPAAASPTPPTVNWILTEESHLLQGRVSWAKVSCVLIIFSSFYTKGDSSAQGDLFSVGTFCDDTIQWCLSGSASCCCCTWPCCCCWAGRPKQLGYGRRPAGLGLAWTCRRRSWSRCSGVSRWEWWALSITPCSWSRGTNSTWRARPAHGPRPTRRPASRSTCSACRPGPTGESRCITQGAGFCRSFGLILFVFWLIEQQWLPFARISYDPTRYPRHIPEAYCLCKGCLVGPHGEESELYRSTPVYAPSVILRRTGSCLGGRHSYTEIYVSIAVGCTCVPLLEKERDGRTSNQSLERAGAKAGQRSAGNKVWREQSCGSLHRIHISKSVSLPTNTLDTPRRFYLWSRSFWNCPQTSLNFGMNRQSSCRLTYSSPSGRKWGLFVCFSLKTFICSALSLGYDAVWI